MSDFVSEVFNGLLALVGWCVATIGVVMAAGFGLTWLSQRSYSRTMSDLGLAIGLGSGVSCFVAGLALIALAKIVEATQRTALNVYGISDSLREMGRGLDESSRAPTDAAGAFAATALAAQTSPAGRTTRWGYPIKDDPA